MLLATLWCLAAWAQESANMGVIWGCTVDGVPVGTREVLVKIENYPDVRVRFLESWTELAWPTGVVDPNARKKKGATTPTFAYRQRFTANSHDGRPAALTSVLELDGHAVELQASANGSQWQVAYTTDGQTRTTEVPVSTVDLSSADLFDPEAERRLSKLDRARILVDQTGRVHEGPVTPLGPSDLTVGGEVLTVEGFEWTSDLGPMRFWYAANGFLVKYDIPVGGRRVVGLMLGSAPRPTDDFQVPAHPHVDSVAL
jgi:hypothetical protein